MQVKEQHRFPNWTDGMKINKNHFIDMENAVIEHLSHNNTAYLSAQNYGLLPALFGRPQSLDINISATGTKSVQVQLRACRAVTGGGHLIEINEPLIERLSDVSCFEAKYDLEDPDTRELYVIVNIEPYKKALYGDPDSEEHPIRHPYTSPTYTIEIAPAQDGNPKGFWLTRLPLTRLLVENETIVEDNKYIPPSVSVQSHPELIAHYSRQKKKLEEIQRTGILIIQKIRGQAERNNRISYSIQLMAERTINYLSTTLGNFAITIPQQSPTYMIATISNLAHIIQSSIKCLTGEEKNELFEYYKIKTGFNTGEYEASIERFLTTPYSHMDISDLLDLLDKFTDKTHFLFKKLSILELIGPEPEVEQEKPKDGFHIDEKKKEREILREDGKKGFFVT